MRIPPLAAMCVCLAAADAAAAQNEFREHHGMIVAEVEHATALRSVEIIARDDASGGRAVRWQNETGRAEFALRVLSPGTWHVWIRTAAQDHLNNGLFLELNGVRQSAPAAHSIAGTEILYLRKHANAYSWKPEWQGPGEGNHEGPITITVPHAGLHRLAIVARRTERPLIDKVVLTREPAPPFVDIPAALGPPSTRGEPLDPQPAARARRAAPLPGQIIVDPDDPRWLKRYGGGYVYICGPGEPEDFLYRGTRNADGTRSGDQLDLINKLIRHGGNCIYMQAVRTHGGDARDDRTHNPFVESDPAKGLDGRILNQWEEWFTLMDQHGIVIYFLFYDDSARIWNTGDQVGADERTFFETIVRTFKHHKNLIWVVGEESEERYSHARVQALAKIIRDADDHGHLIGNHHLSGALFKAWRPGGALNHFSMQLTAAGEEAHAGAIEAFRNAKGRYQVIYAESTATPKDPDGMRRHAWIVAMGGVMPMIYPMDIVNTPPALLEQCRGLQRFFEATDFPTMAPHDELKYSETKYVVADPGRSYIAYADTLSGELGLKDLPAGRCEVTWLDCESGRTTTQERSFTEAGDRAFNKPAGFGPECAAWIRFPDIKPGQRTHADTTTIAATDVSENQPPVVSDTRVDARGGDEVYIQLHFTDPDGPGPYTYTIMRQPQHGTLSGDDNDLYYKPKPGLAGADEFTWKVNDGQADSRSATVTILIQPVIHRPPGTGNYFPPPESQGGWRKLETPDDVRRLGRMDPDQFAIKHLFEPIGCEHWWFQHFEGGENYGRHPTHALGLPARDLARIAYCMLRGGRWSGRQVVPRWFVEETAAPTHALRDVKELRWGRDAAHYSHAWERPTWLTTTPEPTSEKIPGDARFKRGSGGQFIAFVPSLDLVITRQTGGSGQWSYEEYLSRACEAVAASAL